MGGSFEHGGKLTPHLPPRAQDCWLWFSKWLTNHENLQNTKNESCHWEYLTNHKKFAIHKFEMKRRANTSNIMQSQILVALIFKFWINPFQISILQLRMWILGVWIRTCINHSLITWECWFNSWTNYSTRVCSFNFTKL